MWTFATSFGCGPDTTYLLFDEARGWHMHNHPYHDEDEALALADADC